MQLFGWSQDMSVMLTLSVVTVPEHMITTYTLSKYKSEVVVDRQRDWAVYGRWFEDKTEALKARAEYLIQKNGFIDNTLTRIAEELQS